MVPLYNKISNYKFAFQLMMMALYDVRSCHGQPKLKQACLCFAEREKQRAERPTKELESPEGATSADQAEAQEASRRLDEELMSSHWSRNITLYIVHLF